MAALDLRTSRLNLRPVRQDDVAATAKLMCAQVASFLTTWPPKMSLNQAKERIAAAEARRAGGSAIDFAILCRTSGDLLGWISFMVEEPGACTATIGFWLGRIYQGQGIMTEAAVAATPLAAGFLGVTALEAHVYPWNSTSIHLLRKLGFHPEGGASLYSPIRRRTEEAFLYRRDLEDCEIAGAKADAA